MKVLITGGTGSLGRALVRRLISKHYKVVVFSRDEGKQALHFLDDRVSKVIGDVRDFDKLNTSIMRHKPDIVIHAAALKRIDDMEMFPDECIKTNVQGSKNVAQACLNNKVAKCILISTDKACQPVNVYGSSKLIAERLFTNYDYHSENTIFSSVRYGNVICSRGSFIPLWINLVKSNRKITVTSMDMTRFLFTIEDAVDTVLNSIYACTGGEVFIPKINSFGMRTIIKGLEKITSTNIEYNICGLRPGEKLHEDMLAATELPFTYIVPEFLPSKTRLLCVRPQYSNRVYPRDWIPWTGPHFNSSLHVNGSCDDIVSLINRGLTEYSNNIESI